MAAGERLYRVSFRAQGRAGGAAPSTPVVAAEQVSATTYGAAGSRLLGSRRSGGRFAARSVGQAPAPSRTQSLAARAEPVSRWDGRRRPSTAHGGPHARLDAPSTSPISTSDLRSLVREDPVVAALVPWQSSVGTQPTRERVMAVLVRHRVSGMTPEQYDQSAPPLIEKLKTAAGLPLPRRLRGRGRPLHGLRDLGEQGATRPLVQRERRGSHPRRRAASHQGSRRRHALTGPNPIRSPAVASRWRQARAGNPSWMSSRRAVRKSSRRRSLSQAKLRSTTQR